MSDHPIWLQTLRSLTPSALRLRGDLQFTIGGTIYACQGDVLPIVAWGADATDGNVTYKVEPLGWTGLSKGVPYVVVILASGERAALPAESYGSEPMYDGDCVKRALTDAYEQGQYDGSTEDDEY